MKTFLNRVAVVAALVLVTGAAWAADKSGTRPTVISVPRGPGSVSGLGESFEVRLNSGSITESVAILVPPGTAGMTPQLGLSYDSGGGNGPVGLGWALPVPTIQVLTERGLPRYDGTDAFLYQGQELVPVAGGYYRLKNEGSFIRARRSGDGWEVELPSGRLQRFGFDPSSRVEQPGAVFSWALEDELDVFGNRISYFYEKSGGQPYLVEVAYNRRAGAADNRVKLEYQPRPDALDDYRAGFRVGQDRRLSAVRVFAGAGQVRRYQLDYVAEAPLSLLRAVTMYGSDDATALPPLTFDYTRFLPETSTLSRLASAPPRLPGSDPSTELADFDGDGFPDLLLAETGGHSFYRNVGGARFAPAVAVSGAQSVGLEVSGTDLADVDGDGLVDLVAKTGTTASAFRYFPNHGQGQWEPSVVFANNPAFDPEDGATRWADLDQDKQVDAFRLTSSSATWWRNNGDGSWSDGLSLSLPQGGDTIAFTDPRVKLADVNGDRLVDLVWVRSGSVTWWPGMGRGRFDAPRSLAGAPDVGTGIEQRLQLSDLDGDGRADLLLVDTSHVDYWLQEGPSAFGAKRSLAATPYANASLTQVRLGDLNGNGSTDIAWFTPSAAPDDRVVYLDIQKGIRPNLLREVRNGLGKVRTIGYTTSADEYARALSEGSPWSTRVPFSVQLVASNTLSDSRGGTYLTEYRYAEGHYDGRTREFRGFGEVEERELGDAADPTLLTRHWFDLGKTLEALKGREIATEQRDAAGKLFRRQDQWFEAKVYAAGLGGVDSVGAQLTQSEARTYEGEVDPVLTRETYAYDDFGNVVLQRKWGQVVGGDPLAGRDEAFVSRVYVNDTAKWLLGRVIEETTTDGQERVLTRTRHYYDGAPYEGLPQGQLGLGVLTRTEDWVEGSHWVQSRREARDGFGNVVGMMTPRGFVRDIEYDAQTHALPVLERLHLESGDALEFKAAYAGANGLLTRFTDSTGASSVFVYDALERLTAIFKPGDEPDVPTTRFLYAFGDTVSTLTTEQRPAGSDGRVERTTTYTDGLGRNLQTSVQAERDQWVVQGRKEYSRRGAVVAEWDPFFHADDALVAPEAASTPVRYEYDALGRKRRTTFPDGTATEERYGRLFTESWDAEDLDPASKHFDTPIRFEQDGLGRTVAIVEVLDGKTITTRHEYDALGRRTAVVDAMGNRAGYTYDGLGRAIALDHPDAGHREYVYDDDSNQVLNVDARGERVARDYDAAGRLLTETLIGVGGPQGKIVYHYDAPSPRFPDSAWGKGKLSWVEDFAGEEHFSYDERGRLTDDLRVIEGKDYAIAQQHDALDRVTAITYPDGSTLDYVYNPRGLLESVPRVIDGLEYNPQGLATRRAFANGVVSTAEYDRHDRVGAIRSQDKAGKPLQDLGYHYDRAGSLLEITDGLHAEGPRSGARKYGYDTLYRLVSAQTPTGALSYDYDAVGNLRQKSDFGAYAYDPNDKPNAVRSVGGRPLTYDANGSVLSAFGRTFTYDARRELRKVETESAVTEYVYDFEGLRTIKRVTQGDKTKTALYLDKFAEVRDGQLVKYVFAGDVRIARIGGGSPKAIAVMTTAMRGLSQALGLLAFGAVALGGVFLARGRSSLSRQARKFIALGMAAALTSCTCGGPTTAPYAGSVFYLGDHLGSSEVLTDEHGAVVGESSYDPWGQQLVATDEPYGFTGKEWDSEAGVYYSGARYYDPRLGRFLSTDPVAIGSPEKTLDDPQSLNPYAYARNTPTSLADRDGRFAHILVGALVGAAVNTSIYLVKGAITGEAYTTKGLLTAAATGAVEGGVVAATGGLGLVASSGLGAMASGVVERAINTGSAAEAFNPKAMAIDGVVGAVSAKGSELIGKGVAALSKKVVGAVKGRFGSVAKEALESSHLGSAIPCACFAAGTLVTLADGSQVPIESIEVGDWVLAPLDPAKPDQVSAHEVVALPRRIAPDVLDLAFTYPNGSHELVTVTSEHPFAVVRASGTSWTEAKLLVPGDVVATPNGPAQVDRASPRPSATPVFNLTVADAHAYFVGTGGLLVHNSTCPITAGKTHGHHSDPKFLGGDPGQELTQLAEEVHQNLHKDLNAFLRTKENALGHMRPQPGNPGSRIRDNFSREERLEALKEFYKTNIEKYPEAARDFFKQHPTNGG